ncbi:protein METABOLIC NETWORK MODULATOR 1-like [Rutidosis leptorrhynchoides]|uniref:protein METABOLIC NETWORK MODULATOR 1-like n=1 Tax=Rutidosis leptorrhynchoides TaxID=125765 RepID=UPI003A98ECAA
MEPVNQEVAPDVSLVAPEKRKRGRPRKDPSERRAHRARSQAAASIPRNLVQTNNTQRVDPINDPNQVMIGQTVTGVVEATFDAGYLLAVRIGNSSITLRGAVFKPGQTAPVTPENDIAPHAEMIKRSEIPFPTELLPKHRRKRRSKEKNMQLVTYVGNGGDPGLTSTPSVPPVGARGSVVPVVLQPLNLSNGLSTNLPAPHLRATQGKPVHSVLPLAVCPPNVSTSQASESQTSSQFTVTPTGSGNENASFKQAEGTKPIKSHDLPDRVVKTESDIGDMNEQPLFVEPLQTRHTIHHFQPPQVMGAVMHSGPGRMTELLQAVQQNIGDDQGARNGHPAGGYNVSRNRDEETSQGAGRL